MRHLEMKMIFKLKRRCYTLRRLSTPVLTFFPCTPRLNRLPAECAYSTARPAHGRAGV